MKWYVGTKPDYSLEAFRAPTTPTQASHGDKYLYVLGPFRTKRGALHHVTYGKGNPHHTHVDAIEQLAKLMR